MIDFKMARILIFVNGRLPDLEKARRLINNGDLLLAADGGAGHILALGRRPAAVIGDLDSISKEDLKLLTDEGITIIRFPADKDFTDLELALDHALRLNGDRILIVGGMGGRVDQTLGNIGLLTDPRLEQIDVRIDDGVEEVFLCRQRVEVEGSRGDLLSLLPWGAAVEGVCTEGLQWPLAGDALEPHQTRGISNVLLGGKAIVTTRRGILLIVHRRLS
jgi:thiamine pyrophosphokinase